MGARAGSALGGEAPSPFRLMAALGPKPASVGRGTRPSASPSALHRLNRCGARERGINVGPPGSREDVNALYQNGDRRGLADLTSAVAGRTRLLRPDLLRPGVRRARARGSVRPAQRLLQRPAGHAEGPSPA